MTGITRDVLPFTTVLVPDPRQTDLPTTDYTPVYHFGRGRKLLDSEGAKAIMHPPGKRHEAIKEAMQ